MPFGLWGGGRFHPSLGRALRGGLTEHRYLSAEPHTCSRAAWAPLVLGAPDGSPLWLCDHLPASGAQGSCFCPCCPCLHGRAELQPGLGGLRGLPDGRHVGCTPTPLSSPRVPPALQSLPWTEASCQAGPPATVSCQGGPWAVPSPPEVQVTEQWSPNRPGLTRRRLGRGCRGP